MNKTRGHKIINKVNKNKFVGLFLAVVMAVSFVVSAISPTLASAVNTASGKGAEWQIMSDIYYYAIKDCLTFAKVSGGYLNNTYIKLENVDSGKWFDSNSASLGIIGSFFPKTKYEDTPGRVNCDNTSFINDAVAFWGLNAKDLLCWSNFKRETQPPGKTCADGEGDFLQKGSTTNRSTADMAASAEAFGKYINWKIYGGVKADEPGARAANPSILENSITMYVLLKNAVINEGIIPGIGSKPDIIPCTSGFKEIKWIDMGVSPKTVTTGCYSSEVYTKFDTEFKIFPSSKAFLNPIKGKEILDRMNAIAANISTLPDKDIDGVVVTTVPGGSTSADDSCGSKVSGVGWIICPIITGMTELNDSIWGLASGLLKVNPLRSSDGIYGAWGAIRTLANAVFIIVFLIMIFSQLTSIGLSNYGIKKLMPRLIICAILINTSFIIMQLIVDLANILGAGMYDLLASVTSATMPTWGKLMGILTGVAAGGTVAIVGIGAIGISSAFWMVLPMAAGALISLLVAILTLIFRQAIIPVLAILAPLAFVAYLLPNTEKLFKKWKDMLVPMLMLYPLAAIVFGGARFAAGALMSGSGSGDFWSLMMGLIMLAMPLFSLPFLAKKSGAMVGAVGNALGNLGGKIKAPISSASKDRSELARQERLASPTKNWAQGRYQKMNYDKMTRKKRLSNAQTGIDRKWTGTEDAIGAIGAGMTEDERLKAAKTRAEDTWLRTQSAADALKEVNAAEIQKGITKAGVDQKVEIDVPIGLRITAKTAELDLTNAKTAIDTEITEAATNSDAAHLAGIDAGIRSRLQQSQEDSTLNAGRKASADRVLKQEFDEMMVDNTNAASAMNRDIVGGIDPQGAQRARAIAAESMSKTDATNVAAAAAVFSHDRYSGQQYLNVVESGVLADGSPASAEQQRAAVAAIAATKQVPVMSRILDHTAAIARGIAANPAAYTQQQIDDNYDLQQTLSAELIKNPMVGVTGGVIGDMSTGQYRTDSAQLAVNLLINKPPSMETVSKWSADSAAFVRQSIALDRADPNNPNIRIPLAAGPELAAAQARRAQMTATQEARDALVQTINTINSTFGNVDKFSQMEGPQRQNEINLRNELETIATAYGLPVPAHVDHPT